MFAEKAIISGKRNEESGDFTWFDGKSIPVNGI